MKFCANCGNSVSDSATCSNCGKDQRDPQQEGGPRYAKQYPVKDDDTMLKILCALTIAGTSLTIFSGALTMGALPDIDTMCRIIQMAGVLIATGKMTGAIMMLQKRLNGLYIYTVAAALSMLLTISMAFGNNCIPKDAKIPQEITIMSVVIGVVISTTFLVLYWQKANRRLLS